MIYQFIREHSSEFAVKKMCHVLEVTRSAYYEWLRKPMTHRQKTDAKLVPMIKAIFRQSDSTYGARRIRKDLKREYHVSCSRIRVKRLMDENGLFSVHRVKYKATTNSNHNYPIAPNLLMKDFTADAPHQKWVGDITYIKTDGGWLYLAAIEDLFDRRIVGWALGDRITQELTLRAMNQALGREKPPEGLIFHSDRGSQYAAYAYQDLLRDNGIHQSMSAKGDCYDNACMESFFATLKKDRLHRRHFSTRQQARLAVTDYIETFYNARRLHSSLGDMAPNEYHMLFLQSKMTAA